jgi:hypothetical protein
VLALWRNPHLSPFFAGNCRCAHKACGGAIDEGNEPLIGAVSTSTWPLARAVSRIRRV